MAHLPPVGWADVATKHDLAALEARMDLRFDAHEQRFRAELHSEISHLQRFFVTAMFAWGSVLMAVALAIGKVT